MAQPDPSNSDPDVPYFTIHPLTHLWARVRLDRREQENMAFEALPLFYRSPRRTLLPIYYDLEDIILFYQKYDPCNLEEVFRFGDLDFAVRDRIAGWLLRIKAALIEPIWSLYRNIFVADRASSLTHLEVFTYITSDLVLLGDFSWIMCQLGRSFGTRHPSTVYWLGNFAHSKYEMDELWLSLRIYKWLFVSRSGILGINHPATTGAMMGISRAPVRKMPERGLEGKGLHDVCPTALHYAMGAYERSLLRGQGEDGLRGRNALTVLNEVKCAWFHQIQYWKTQANGPGLSTYSDELKSPKDALDWFIVIKPILPPPQPLVSLERPETRNTDYHSTLQGIYGFSNVQNSLKELIIDPQFHTGCAKNYYFTGFVTGVQELGHKVSNHPNLSYDSATCVQMSAAIALYRVYTMGQPREHSDAGRWVERLLNEIPLEWYADGFCDSELWMNDQAWLSYDYLNSMLCAALGPFKGDDFDLAPLYLTTLLTMRALLLLERLGYRMILDGWDRGLCLVRVVMDLKSMLRLEDRRGSIFKHPAIVAAAEEMIELLGDDRSEWCFSDLRRAHMCAASASHSHSYTPG
ncbi:hypothetical protein QBC37DRAFT_107221 [Rhypophila decipiens]|uniref:Uncharacterized protein n=1 Tax=Rhypophila decipiens TaxID=261697 RepID=A0AAN7AZ87_9PEZI|nr:hypothetical protein QBC37DRAFT_107221 [Rhypophila decipiens]